MTAYGMVGGRICVPGIITAFRFGVTYNGDRHYMRKYRREEVDECDCKRIMNFSDAAGILHGATYTMQVTLTINGSPYSAADVAKA